MRRNTITQITIEDYMKLYWGPSKQPHVRCWYCDKGHENLEDLQLFYTITYGDFNNVPVRPVTIYMKFCNEVCLNCWILQ
jgi:hypothetical protein